MKEYMKSLLLPSLLLLVVGCGGGGGNSVSQGTVRLSGAIGFGDITPATESVAANRFGSSPRTQIVVVAVDENGNSYASTTDSAGNFEFPRSVGILANTGYGLVFIDMSSLAIIATLTTGTGEAGLLTLQGDTEIAEIVIQREIRLAAIFGEVVTNGETVDLKVVAADSLDANGDGQISSAEILSTLVNTTQTGNIDLVNSISAFTFLGHRYTWTIAVDLEDEAFEDSVCDWIDLDDPPAGYPTECDDDDDDNDPEIAFLTDSGEITMLATDRVEGPEGNLIDAAKILEMTFLNKPYANPDSDFAEFVDESLIWDVGFASGGQAEINATASEFGDGPGNADEYWTPYINDTLGAAPAATYGQQMGLLGWSEYSYADSEQGLLTSGAKERDSDDGTLSIVWGGTSLPLNLPVNTEFEFTETETNEEIDPETGDEILVTESVTSLITVQLAKNGDGTPAILEIPGAEALKLPVFQVRFTNPEDGESECSYLIAHYGVEGDDADEDCDDSSDWQESFVDVRFGDIMINGSEVIIVDQTPPVIVANDSGEEGLPVDSSGDLTSNAIDWLEYIFRSSATLDYQFESLGVGDGDDFGDTTEFLAWVERPVDGSPLTPQPVAGGNDTLFNMGEAPGNITVSDVHYQSSEGSVQFYLDLRTGEEEDSVYEEPVAINNSVDTSSATDGDTVIEIIASMPTLPADDDEIWIDLWLSLEDPDGSGSQIYNTTQVTVWIIIDADADLDTEDDQYEFPVDSYKVIDPVPTGS